MEFPRGPRSPQGALLRSSSVPRPPHWILRECLWNKFLDYGEPCISVVQPSLWPRSQAQTPAFLPSPLGPSQLLLSAEGTDSPSFHVPLAHLALAGSADLRSALALLRGPLYTCPCPVQGGPPTTARQAFPSVWFCPFTWNLVANSSEPGEAGPSLTLLTELCAPSTSSLAL